MCPARLVETSQRRAVQSPIESGQSRARQINERALRRWELTFDSIDGILTEVERAWALTFGPVLSISYTPPGGSAVDVRFAEDTLERVRRNAAAGSVTVILEEIR
jgi:hypothetical protein